MYTIVRVEKATKKAVDLGLKIENKIAKELAKAWSVEDKNGYKFLAVDLGGKIQ